MQQLPLTAEFPAIVLNQPKPQAKKKGDGFEFFETPEPLAFAIASMMRDMYGHSLPENPVILDFGAGSGRLGDAERLVNPTAHIVGAEIRTTPKPDSYDEWHQVDLLWGPPRYIEYADGLRSNPPFSANNFWLSLERGHQALKISAYGAYLMRTAGAQGQDRCGVLFQTIPYRAIYLLPERPSFTGNGKTDTKTEYAVLVVQKGYIPSYAHPREVHELWWKNGYSIDKPPAGFKPRRKSSVQSQQSLPLYPQSPDCSLEGIDRAAVAEFESNS